MQTPAPASPPFTVPAVPASAALATPWARLAARLLDGLIQGLPFVLFALAARPVGPNGQLESGVIAGGGIVWGLVIAIGLAQIVMLSLHGQTIGKKILHIKIIGEFTGTSGGFFRNFVLREFVNGLLGLVPFYAPIDLLFIFSDRNRCLHDRIAGTLVVRA